MGKLFGAPASGFGIWWKLVGGPAWQASQPGMI